MTAQRKESLSGYLTVEKKGHSKIGTSVQEMATKQDWRMVVSLEKKLVPMMVDW